jgi:integrase
MQRRIRFTRKVIENLLPCPADHSSGEIEYTSLEAPPGLKLVITKRGIKSWLLRYTIQSGSRGVKRAIKIGTFPGMEPAEACRVALDHRGQIAQGIDPLTIRKTLADEPSLNDFFQQDYFPNAKTLRSIRDVESRWRLHIAPAFGHLRFRDLKPADILRFHDAKRLQTCAATANRLLALLKRVINVAIMFEQCDRNPCRGIRMHAEQNIRQRTLAGDELKRFVSALAEEPNRVAADFLLFSLATAGRREECLQITWSEVSMEERVWLIPAARCKSGKSRVVPLNDVAMQVLKVRAEADNGIYVFPGKAGRHLVNPAKAFLRVIRRANISDLKIHDLRRSAATLLINNGGNMTQAQNLLGHASSSLTATRYAFLADAQIVDATRRLSSMIAEAGGLSGGIPA